MPGAKWAKGDRWIAPLSWPVCIAMRGVFGDDLDISTDLLNWGWRESDSVHNALKLRERALDTDPEASDPILRPYQRTGVDFLNVVGNAVLADEMGLGKTIEVVATLEETNAYPALVVCPKAVKRSWQDTFAWLAPERTVTVVEAGKHKARQLTAETDVTIVNWDLLRTSSRIAGYGSIRLTDKEKTDGPLNRQWGAVVADEAHKAKDPKSKQTRALWAVGSSAARRLALTGTPVANDPRDFWSLLRFVEPHEWPSRSVFMDRYCLLSPNYWGGVDVLGLRPETKNEFHDVTDRRFLRRVKSVVARDLPEKTYVVRETPMSPQQTRAYRQMLEMQVAELDNDEMLAAFNPLTVNTRLLQFSSAMAALEGEEVTLTSPSNKVEGLVELLEETDEPLVVFAVSRQLVDLACDRLTTLHVPHSRITGAENDRQREAAKAAFLRGDSRVILLTMGAGGTGLDGLQQRASTVVFLQRSYSYVENVQAEDRLHRIGQRDTVTVIDLITPDTIEETVVLPAVRRKTDMANEVTRDREAIRRLYNA